MSKENTNILIENLCMSDYIKVTKEISSLEEEIKRLKEEYIMLQNASDEVEEEKDKEIDKLTFESTKWESKFYDEAKKVDRAIEYIEKNSYTTIETIDDINYFIVRLDKCPDLLDILKGVDKA